MLKNISILCRKSKDSNFKCTRLAVQSWSPFIWSTSSKSGWSKMWFRCSSSLLLQCGLEFSKKVQLKSYKNCHKNDIFHLLEWLDTGAAEQVKQVKQLLHRNSELLLQINFKHLGYMKGKNFCASPEKSSFRCPWLDR